MPKTLPQELMDELTKEYVATFQTKVDQARTFLRDGQTEELHRLFHKLAGSGSTYLMPEITQFCRAAEQWIEKVNFSDTSESQSLHVAHLVESLEKILTARQSGTQHDIQADPVFNSLMAVLS